MKSVLFWSAGIAAAFALTAGAFLLFASFAEDSSSSVVEATDQDQSPISPLGLAFRESELSGLSPEEDQEMTLTVRNKGERDLSGVNVVLVSSPADTSRPQNDYYRADIGELAAGESTSVSFNLDLSTAVEEEDEEWILEARAATPGGISTLKTAVIEL